MAHFEKLSFFVAEESLKVASHLFTEAYLKLVAF